jgi:ABC-type dipeptide/oligopeptide/nickel transport system ATPase component
MFAAGLVYAVPYRVPKHHTTLLTGEGGAGKSILYMQLMAGSQRCERKHLRSRKIKKLTSTSGCSRVCLKGRLSR